jgi:molybdate transport system ATP-binding protein
VRENLLYGYVRAPAAARRLRLEDIVDALGIAPLVDRGVRALSGGERQRVALGRALLAQPRLLLLDEPLAGVDSARKGEALSLIRRVQARFALAVLHVSHDLDEVAALADHVALMRSGRIAAHAPAGAMFVDPASPLSERADARALIDGRIAEQHDGLTIVQAGDARLVAPAHAGAPGDPVRLHFFARDVTLALKRPETVSTRNILAATIRAMRTRADGQALILLDAEAGPLLSMVTQDAVRDLGLAPGLSLFALVKAVAVK